MLQQLNDDADVGRYVLDGCRSHDVCRILIILVIRSPIGENQHDVCMLNLHDPSISFNECQVLLSTALQ